jgi:hypothetical protein
MANTTETTSSVNIPSSNLSVTLPTTKAVGDQISADTFRQMLDVLENLQSHNHIFYDDYTTVCECQCACACGRGTV